MLVHGKEQYAGAIFQTARIRWNLAEFGQARAGASAPLYGWKAFTRTQAFLRLHHTDFFFCCFHWSTRALTVVQKESTSVFIFRLYRRPETAVPNVRYIIPCGRSFCSSTFLSVDPHRLCAAFISVLHCLFPLNLRRRRMQVFALIV